jgi:TetR/AcrR family transcriptional regulator, regulator of biofilm formation and stress response
VTETVDRRLVRGQRRRAQLIDATLEVIERDGVGGVSHRSVARIAGVSPSAAIHYFATLDDLLVAAVTSANEESLAAVEEIEGVADFADLLADQVVSHRTRFVALYELYLLAARRPALRQEAHRWIESVKDAARRLGADDTGARAVAAALDGLGLQSLVEDELPDRDEVAAILRAALG